VKRVSLPSQGIALVEAMVAVVILALGLLGTIGMQARSYSALAEAGARTEATMAAEKLVGLMTTDQANLASYVLVAGATPDARLLPWYNETRAHIPNASIAVAVAPVTGTGSTQVVVTIGWTRKAGTAPSTHRVSAYIAQST
jgi:type IV pilus assembly protein PilV